MFGAWKDKMKQLQEMQQKVEEIKKRLDTISVMAQNADGSIKVVCSGNREIKEIIIDTGRWAEWSDTFKQELMQVINESLRQGKNIEESEMRAAAGSFMPGLDNLLG